MSIEQLINDLIELELRERSNVFCIFTKKRINPESLTKNPYANPDWVDESIVYRNYKKKSKLTREKERFMRNTVKLEKLMKELVEIFDT